MTISNGEQKNELRFYRPAMAPSFVDSKRSTKLGFSFSACCESCEIGNGNLAEKRIEPALAHSRNSRPRVNPLFEKDDTPSPIRTRSLLSPPRPIIPQDHAFEFLHPPLKNLEIDSKSVIVDETGSGSSSSPSPQSSPFSPLSDPKEISWKGVNLPVYDGAWDADALEEWISKIDFFFHQCGRSLSEEDKISCAVFHLTGTAHKWWRKLHSNNNKDHRPPQQQQQQQSKKQNAVMIRSWRDLKTELIKFFMPIINNDNGCDNGSSLMRRKLDNLKQLPGTSLREYDQLFLNASLDASKLLSQWEIVQSYVEGLRNRRLQHLLNHAVLSNSADNLQYAMRMASFYHQDPATHCPWCNANLVWFSQNPLSCS